MRIWKKLDGWIEVQCTTGCGALVPIPAADPNRYYSDPIICLECQDRLAEPRPSYYSGPSRSGICVCGHSWEEHHLGMVVRPGATKVKDGDWEGREGYIPQECEYYGNNEMGGLDESGEGHCFGYVDRGTEKQ